MAVGCATVSPAVLGPDVPDMLHHQLHKCLQPNPQDFELGKTQNPKPRHHVSKSASLATTQSVLGADPRSLYWGLPVWVCKCKFVVFLVLSLFRGSVKWSNGVAASRLS